MTYEYERLISPSSGLRLHLNENTAGCSPRVLEAIRLLTREQAAFYPDYEETIAACARRLGVPPERVALTNGLDEGILITCIASTRGFFTEQPEAIVIVPAFDMYAADADAVGARVVEVPTLSDFRFPLQDVLRAITARTRVIFITNPNNPTGQLVEPDAILELAAAAPAATIFVDEAYADFAGRSLLDGGALDRHSNLIVGRTFAKAYGLAALRVGALVGCPQALAPLRRVLPPYNLNICATVALRAGLEDTEYYEWYLDQVRSSKGLLYQTLDRLNVPYWKSAANFVLADFGGNASRVVAGLAARDIHVRDKSRDPLCPGCLRITAGVVAHTKACIAALEEVLCGAAS